MVSNDGSQANTTHKIKLHEQHASLRPRRGLTSNPGEVRARAARSPHSSEHALVTMAMAMTTAANPGEGGEGGGGGPRQRGGGGGGVGAAAGEQQR